MQVQRNPLAVSPLSFFRVGGEYTDKISVVAEIFKRILEPLYGSQDKAIGQIRESSDRRCFLMYEEDNPVGVLAFKTLPSNEFEEFGVRNSIEIKSLFIDHSQQNSSRGLGSSLVDKLKHEVDCLGCNYEGIHVTVSETKQESLAFFKAKGFSVVHEWKGRYLPNVTEYLLSCPRYLHGVTPTIEDLTNKMQSLSTDEPPELMHIIHGAHTDDIHSLKKLSDNTFISGSKDNGIRKWSFEGKLIKIVDEVEPTLRTDASWITSMEIVSDDYWVSGARNGEVVLWKTNGDYVKELKPKLPRNEDCYIKKQNLRRVTCLAPGANPLNPSFFLGFPTMFQTFNLIEGKTTSIAKVHDNDWPFVIKPLAPNKALVVVAASVKVWTQEEDANWVDSGTVMKEPPRYKDENNKPSRAFIPDMISLNALNDQFAVANFDSKVRLLDVPSQTVVKSWKEHDGKVWKLEKLTGQVFASSGEDETVKLWDIRQNKSARTIKVGHGKVTSMVALNEHTLVTGSCPEKLVNNNKSAKIRIYSFRK